MNSEFGVNQNVDVSVINVIMLIDQNIGDGSLV